MFITIVFVFFKPTNITAGGGGHIAQARHDMGEMHRDALVEDLHWDPELLSLWLPCSHGESWKIRS